MSIQNSTSLSIKMCKLLLSDYKNIIIQHSQVSSATVSKRIFFTYKYNCLPLSLPSDLCLISTAFNYVDSKEKFPLRMAGTKCFKVMYGQRSVPTESEFEWHNLLWCNYLSTLKLNF
uniref:Uncharacterized protein n=1 Tax=Anguilla anguilla TaxID=7936 RepID=A0A0E9WWB8_ANGAN